MSTVDGPDDDPTFQNRRLNRLGAYSYFQHAFAYCRLKSKKQELSNDRLTTNQTHRDSNIAMIGDVVSSPSLPDVFNVRCGAIQGTLADL